MPLDKADNEIGALWHGKSQKGNEYWSGSLELTHNKKTLQYLCNCLQSGGKLPVMIFTTKYKNAKAPTHSIVIPQDAMEFLERYYQSVLHVPYDQLPDYRAYAKEQRLIRTGAQAQRTPTQQAPAPAPTPPPPQTEQAPPVAPSDVQNPFGV